MRCLLALAGSFWLFMTGSAFAENVRYFGVWSYTENALAEEIGAEDRASRRLGYWALNFDEEGRVLAGTYQGGDGSAWVTIRYVVVEDRLYADLFGPDGAHRARKSTQLTSQHPVGFDPR